jgi:hypothetical protein
MSFIEELMQAQETAHVEEEISSLQLPPGWTKEISVSTGQMYYYNAETGATTYDFPREDQLVQIDVDMATGRGFGMEIEWDGSVVNCKPGSVSALAFVPCPSKIVSIGGVGVRSKEDVVEAVKQTGGQPTVRFSFLVDQEVSAKREEAMAAPGPTPALAVIAQRLQAQETARVVVIAPEPAPAPAAATAAQAAAQPEAAASGRVVVRDAAALRAAVADRGGAPVVELDPAGGVFALGTERLDIRRPVRLVSGGAGGRATLARGEGAAIVLVVVCSPGVALEGLALVAGTDERGDQQVVVWVNDGGEAELRGCDVTGAVRVAGTAALRDCAVHDVTNSSYAGVNVDGLIGAGRATLERCTIERCAGYGVWAQNGGVARLVETTVRECQDHNWVTNDGVIEGVFPGLVKKF